MEEPVSVTTFLSRPSLEYVLGPSTEMVGTGAGDVLGHSTPPLCRACTVPIPFWNPTLESLVSKTGCVWV